MQDPFEEYLRQGEPDSAKRAELWQVAIGLQAVDGLKPSHYLIETAQKHIACEYTIDEVESRISAYYKSAESRKEVEGTDEADIVASRITRLLSEKKFTFAPAMLSSIHRQLFGGVLTRAGKYRQFNITKKEWVLDGDTVLYAPCDMLSATLNYDFSQEKAFSYKGLSTQEAIAHIATFISGIWQIHPFAEGNTRTTAVFTIKYLQSLGYNVNNDPFKQHSWYFRNALVRANYRNITKDIERTTEYLERFFRNLLLGEHNELKNRYLHIRWNSNDENNSVVQESYAPFNRTKRSVENIKNTEKSSVETTKSSVETTKSSVEIEKSSVEIVRLMTENPKITAAQIAERLGITTRAVEKQIAKLRTKEIIKRVGSNKGGHWEIIEKT
ncbi:MAG: Fic family protein [Bacteroidales bacterium]|nr:Fic family protein [Bacteroidales bacterium]